MALKTHVSAQHLVQYTDDLIMNHVTLIFSEISEVSEVDVESILIL